MKDIPAVEEAYVFDSMTTDAGGGGGVDPGVLDLWWSQKPKITIAMARGMVKYLVFIC